jgi:GNAT superfamily N-acetyltransferase
MLIVERMKPQEWQRARAIRLRALEDTPDAFGSTLSHELKMPDDQWQARLASSNSVTFVAALGDRDIGITVGAPYDNAAGLFAMWVAPEARGKGVGDALVAAVINWASENRFERILLDVGDWNRSAINLYKRNGFEPTGHTGTLPPPRTHVTEHQRERRLR